MQAGTLITPRLAEEAIYSRLTCLPIESLPLTQCVGGTLRENVYAERDQPPFDRVTMDGIAVDSEALRQGQRRFRIQGTQAAGAPALKLKASDDAIEVMTGAILPVGCDSVIPVEQLDVVDGIASLNAAVVSSPFHNIHRRGSDSQQGRLLLEAGTLLRAPEIAVAASAGMARVRVSSQPAIMVVSTGDELIEPGDPIADFQVRRSNAYAVAATLRKRGFGRVGDDHVPDDENLLRERLSLHLTTHEVVVLSGGVSMGKFDLVPKVLMQLGVQEVFHNIAQRPGRPMWFGIGQHGQAVFGLPGNPVSTLVCLTRYVIPAIAEAMGTKRAPAERLALASPVTVKPALTYFLPVVIEHDDWGRPWANPRPPNGSGDFLSLAGTDGFVELPPGPNTYPKGFVTSVYRW
ncbi:MAG TPA: molybdopterin molybdotransferase MoeA [Steroidobacteraceae bacterium]|jgi:molybdopterin molybdotransferase|nr:molybdopterin molybdotransferase MoeA [Steroidobacteraceae bacterium]